MSLRAVQWIQLNVYFCTRTMKLVFFFTWLFGINCAAHFDPKTSYDLSSSLKLHHHGHYLVILQKVMWYITVKTIHLLNATINMKYRQGQKNILIQRTSLHSNIGICYCVYVRANKINICWHLNGVINIRITSESTT